MRKTLAFAASSALLLTAAAPALAQQTAPEPATPSATTTQASPAETEADASTPSATGAASAQMSGANASVTTGMSVKDKMGATIGQVSGVQTGADGKTTATIAMGADTFAVDTSALAVVNGAATVNATHDEIKAMLKK